MQPLRTETVREHYDKENRVDYEAQRWSSSPVARSGYTLTKEALERFVLPRITNIHEYLELGPGPGTWTEMIRKRIPDVKMHLVDISREMLASARKNLGEGSLMTYTESDFLQFAPEKQYDIFFSSRAIEYFPDKNPVVQTIAGALRKGGEAYIITKHPHYLRMKLLGKKAGEIHSGQVTPKALEAIFKSCGMDVLEVRPVFVVIPVFRSAQLNLFASRLLRLFPWNPLTASVTESYFIRVKKL